VLFVVIVLADTLSAHRLDELLQAARIAVARDRVEIELDLTPGPGMVDAIIADIDRDGDGTISAGEQQAYVVRVLNSVELTVDGRALTLEATAWTFPGREAFRRSEGTIRLQAAASFDDLSGGVHRLSFRNTYRREASVYLANALSPGTDDIVVTSQRRDPQQRQLTIDYVVGPGGPGTMKIWILGGSVYLLLVGHALLLRRQKAWRQALSFGPTDLCSPREVLWRTHTKN
jgi:hypothetical protein